MTTCLSLTNPKLGRPGLNGCAKNKPEWADTVKPILDQDAHVASFNRPEQLISDSSIHHGNERGVRWPVWGGNEEPNPNQLTSPKK